MSLRYTFIDAPKIIPLVREGELYFLLDLLRRNHEEPVKDKHKLYITCEKKGIIHSVIFCDGDELYELNNHGINPFKETKPLDENKLSEIELFLNKKLKTVSFQNATTETKNEIRQETVYENDDYEIKVQKETHEQLYDTIHNTGDNQSVHDDNEKNNEDSEEDILKECEKLMETYEQNKERKKNIQSTKLKIEKKEKELIKMKRDKIQDKIIKVVGNFRTYNNILKANAKAPEFFTIQYEYFEDMNNEDKEYLHVLIEDKKTDNYILNAEAFDEKLVNIASAFDDVLKENFNKNKVVFEHPWAELDDDVQNIKVVA